MDVDGVVWIRGAPGKGAREMLVSLDQKGIPFCLLTNDCTASKGERYRKLAEADFQLREDQLLTAPEITAQWLTNAESHKIMYLGAPGALADIASGVTVEDDSPVDAVIVGDLFDYYDRRAIDRAAKAVEDGAVLVAMQRNPRWHDGKNWYVDNGFWVAGFEYVTGREAVITGKPSSGAYLTALRRVGASTLDCARTAFVSDDVEVDLKGASAVGLRPIYFGPPRDLPAWIDDSVPDMAKLTEILVGDSDD
jgi:HAD superfamily hydrolase (TIGR01450 family)